METQRTGYLKWVVGVTLTPGHFARPLTGVELNDQFQTLENARDRRFGSCNRRI